MGPRAQTAKGTARQNHVHVCQPTCTIVPRPSHHPLQNEISGWTVLGTSRLRTFGIPGPSSGRQAQPEHVSIHRAGQPVRQLVLIASERVSAYHSADRLRTVEVMSPQNPGLGSFSLSRSAYTTAFVQDSRRGRTGLCTPYGCQASQVQQRREATKLGGGESRSTNA